MIQKLVLGSSKLRRWDTRNMRFNAPRAKAGQRASRAGQGHRLRQLNE